MVTFKSIKVLIVIISTQLLVSHLALYNLHKGSKQNVGQFFRNTTLLVIAHPDDETMFFGPTVLKLLDSDRSIVILCLTTGNSDKVNRRDEELKNVVRALGPNVNLKLINDSKLPDGMKSEWDLVDVAGHMESVIKENDKQIDTLVTFDSYGVSGHINHRSIYWATKLLKTKLHELGIRIDILHLQSVSIWRKYISYCDSIMTYLQDYLEDKSARRTITLALDVTGYSILKKVLEEHQSQMVWFRQLYMIFSRYMFLNDLKLDNFEKPHTTQPVSN